MRLCIEKSAATWSALAWPGHQRRSQHAAHLLREVVAVSGVERVDLLVAADGAARDRRPASGAISQSAENTIGVLLGIEAQRRPEEAAERPDILRLAMGEPDLDGFPFGPHRASA